MTKKKLPPIVKDRLLISEPFTKTKPVYLICTGFGLPDDVWDSFAEAEQHCLGDLRETFSTRFDLSVGKTIYET